MYARSTQNQNDRNMLYADVWKKTYFEVTIYAVVEADRRIKIRTGKDLPDPFKGLKLKDLVK